jgi:hypothetical protein
MQVMQVVTRITRAGVVAALLATTAVAAAADTHMVDSIMARSALERGAFLACARSVNDKESIEALTLGWTADLKDSAKLLREKGYDEAYVGALATRFNLETAVPALANVAAATKFCAMLGDWKQRYFSLLFSSPALELKRQLQR